jgi:hypothetical protein
MWLNLCRIKSCVAHSASIVKSCGSFCESSHVAHSASNIMQFISLAHLPGFNFHTRVHVASNSRQFPSRPSHPPHSQISLEFPLDMVCLTLLANVASPESQLRSRNNPCSEYFLTSYESSADPFGLGTGLWPAQEGPGPFIPSQQGARNVQVGVPTIPSKGAQYVENCMCWSERRSEAC